MSKADEIEKVECIQLDVIPIYVNEMYPTREAIWHFRAIKENDSRQRERMIQEIKHKFSDCNAVIVLEKGMVIEVL